MKKKVRWICSTCGLAHGKNSIVQLEGICSTFHNGTCDVCGEKKAVTQGRDFGVYEVEVSK